MAAKSYGRVTSFQIFDQVMTDIRERRFKKIYFLSGTETFFIDRVQDALIELIPKESRDFNLDILYGQDTHPSQVLGLARSFPMMGERRLVILREFSNMFRQDIKSEEKDGGKGESQDMFIPYLERANESSILVMQDSKTPPRNQKFGKALAANSDNVGFYTFNAVPDDQIPSWIMEWAGSHHKKEILPDAAQLLFQISGNSLHQLSIELDKLCTQKETDEPISRADVKDIAGFSRQFTVFELKDAIIARDERKAYFIAEQILQESKSGIGEILRILGYLYNQFSQLWIYERLVQKKLTNDQIADQLGLKGKSVYKLKYMAQEARAYPIHKMPEIFEALLDADKASKGFSKLDSDAILLMTIKRIIS